MPDLGDAKNLELFLKWDGTSKHAHLIKMRKVKLSDSHIPASKKNKYQPAAKGDRNEVVDMKEEAEEDSGEERIGKEEEEEEGSNEQELEEEDNCADEDDRTDSMDVDMKADP